MTNKLESLKKKILYRSLYRGTKEMDLLLSNFVKSKINCLDISDLEDLLFFLNLEDEDIYAFYQNNQINEKIPNNKITSMFKDYKL